jgi:hypothetical protein
MAGDGNQTLYVGADIAKPVTIYCADMATTPLEYLTLPNQSNANFSQGTAGGAWPGTNVRTIYQRVRIELPQLRIITNDGRFSTSTGSYTHGGSQVTSVEFASALSCNQAPSGLGNVDLTGTPFAVAPNAFLIGGFQPSGTTMYSAGDRIVALTGGGYCGWNAPIGYPGSNVPLPLVYVGP